MTELEQLRRRSARMAHWMGLLFVALAALLVLERFGWLAVGGPAPGRRVDLSIVRAVPDALYLAALWWIRCALAELAEGRLFAIVVSRALQRVGALMLAGSALSVFLLPTLLAWLGEPPGYLIAYDMSKTVIGAVGLALGVVSRLLRQAAAIQAELDEMF